MAVAAMRVANLQAYCPGTRRSHRSGPMVGLLAYCTGPIAWRSFQERDRIEGVALPGDRLMDLPAFLVDHPDGEIRLVDHRIGLYTIVREYKDGRSVEEIAEEYPTLSVDLIRRVIGFYLSNRGDVDAYVEVVQKELDRQAAAPPGPGTLQVRELMRRIEQADREHGKDPGWASLSPAKKLTHIP
jgi:uncharacterized protein (DUF433 family)